MGNGDQSAAAGDVQLTGPGETCVTLSGCRLRAGSDRFERVWRILADGVLLPESFHDRVSGIQWIMPDTNIASSAAAPESVRLDAIPRHSAVAADSLNVRLQVSDDERTTTYLLQIWPSVRGVRITRQTANNKPDTVATVDETPGNRESLVTGVETDESGADTPKQGMRRAQIDGFALAPVHLRLVQISFQDQTDSFNELVREREWLLHTSERELTLSGCLFFVEDVLTGAGLIYLKEAPLPECRPGMPRFDLNVAAAARRIGLMGEFDGNGDPEYPAAIVAYDGGKTGRVAAIHAYQRAQRPYLPGRDGLFLSNTWGDRNRDGRIREEFMAQEIEAGARLGVDVVQIDDGWQVGATSNSVRAGAEGGVWEGFYAARDNFWGVHPDRFPNGLAPLVAAAQERRMRFGLWFGPDSANDFAAWRRDAETIVDLHRMEGIDYFKIDGVKIRSRTGERNLRAFFDHVLDTTEGRVTFDLDITAETRPGYFGLVDTGPLFVENRYTDWRRYWPHQTLRNLWKLAHYVDPLRLRMEWLNNTRNIEKYAEDPLAPNVYRPDYLFATVMFSSPLGWFEVANLPESYFDEAAPLIATWKTHRERIFGGLILPIGDAPDGVSWTGIVSITPDSLYVLAFREFNASAQWRTVLPFAPDVDAAIEADRLGGDGQAQLLPGRVLNVAIAERQRFFFGRIESAGMSELEAVPGQARAVP